MRGRVDRTHLASEGGVSPVRTAVLLSQDHNMLKILHFFKPLEYLYQIYVNMHYFQAGAHDIYFLSFYQAKRKIMNSRERGEREKTCSNGR